MGGRLMRVWGRLPTIAGGNVEALQPGAAYTWVADETDAQGWNDYPYLTALCQCLKLNLGESPFFGNFGIPARTSVRQQIPPDYAVAFTQSYFAPFFASLIITKAAATQPPLPTYNLSIIRNSGSVFKTQVAL